jgi:protocatechuate 3,4-dioxygenase beta subunit
MGLIMFGVSRLLAVALSTSIILGGGVEVAAAQRTGDGVEARTKTSAVEGVALNAVTGMPVKKAHVTLRYAAAAYELRYDAETNGSGHFMVIDVKPGNYWLQLEKRGFVGTSTKFLSLDPGQHLRDILLRATPCSVISGRVLREDGEPITGAEVQAIRWTQEGRGQQMRVASARTNDLGQYRLYGLTPGIYYVAAHYDAEESSGGIERTDSQVDESYVKTFYPDTTDPSGATPISVAAGAEVDAIDIDLLKSAGKLVTSLMLPIRTEEDKETEQEQNSNPAILQPIAAEARQNAVIEGEVVNQVTAIPLRGAKLMLRRAGVGLDAPYVVESDAHGHFSMNKVEPGQYRLWATDKGLAEQEYRAEGPDAAGKVLTLMPGQHLQGILFRVIPPAVITGKVLDEDSEPILGADVQAMRFSYQEGKRQLQIEAVSATNDLGEFRLHGLEPGKYYVSTNSGSVIDGDSGRLSASRHDVRTFFPHTTEISAATPISVAAGEEAGGIEISAISDKGIEVAGQVLNPGASRIAGEVMVTLVPRDASGLAFSSGKTTGVDSQGHFALQDVLPGSYFLWVNWFHGHEQYYAGRMIEVANADIRDLRLVTSKAVNLVGNLRIEGVDEQGIANLHNLHIALEPESGVSNTVGANVKPDGSFVITSVPPFRYTLNVLGMDENLYIKSLDVIGEIQPDLKLDVDRVGGGPITIVLSALGKMIRGRVVDENQLPARGARVVLVPDGSRRRETQLYKTATTDSYGQFKLAGISPGKYELFAWRNMEGNAYLDPDFLQQVEEFGQEITVSDSSNEESSNENTVLTLIPISDERLR